MTFLSQWMEKTEPSKLKSAIALPVSVLLLKRETADADYRAPGFCR